MATFILQNRGYDCNERGPTLSVEAETRIEAIQQMPGMKRAAHIERTVPGQGSTFVVYERAGRATGSDWNKIGVVFDATP